MLFKETMQKTKNFFQKTLQSLKNFFFGSYENSPRTLFLNPLSCSSINQRNHHLDQIYPELISNSNQSPTISNKNQHNPNNSMKQTNNIDATHTIEVIPSYETTTDEMKNVVTSKEVQHSTSTSTRTQTPTPTSFRYANDGAYLLAQKMKELEMMDMKDVDHSLDVEEALHYYSRLTCPEYVDIVNKFFMDMYADFHLPQRSISINSSSRRLGPLAL